MGGQYRLGVIHQLNELLVKLDPLEVADDEHPEVHAGRDRRQAESGMVFRPGNDSPTALYALHAADGLRLGRSAIGMESAAAAAGPVRQSS